MRKAFILICALIALLAVVSCKQDIDPNIYEYDPTSYLGAWEMNFAEADGDEDGCIHLLQINLEKDGTYSCVEYYYNAETKSINVDSIYADEDVDYGEYKYIQETGEIELQDSELFPDDSFFWTEETGLRFYNGLKRYDFSRPKYVIKLAKDQSALEGVWEFKAEMLGFGLMREQVVFNADGSANILFETSYGVDQESFSKSWKYQEAPQVIKNYQISRSIKWYQGSEMDDYDDSFLNMDIHKQKNSVVLETTEIIIDDGDETTSVKRVSYPYFILDYGNEKLLVAPIQNNQNVGYGTLVKKSQSDMIDVNKEFEPVVRGWEIYTGKLVVYEEDPTDTHAYLNLKSDGTFYVNGENGSYLTDNGNILTPVGPYPHDGYYGTYSIDLEKVYVDSFLDSMKIQWMEHGVEPASWDAWRNDEMSALIKQTDYSYEFYKGTLTLNPKYGGSEEFEITVCKRTELYGDNDPEGEPGVSSIILYKKGVKDYRWLCSNWILHFDY